MTIEFRCPGCNAPLRADAGHVGKKAKCKGCGDVVIVPARGGDSYEVVESKPPAIPRSLPIQNEHVAATTPQVAEPPAPSCREMPGRGWPDPWYYRVVSGLVTLVVAITVGQFCIFLIWAVFVFVDAGNKLPTAADWLYVVVPMFFWSSGILLSGLLWACPILIFLDIGRNIRTMRMEAAYR